MIAVKANKVNKSARARATIKNYASSFFEKDVSDSEKCEQIAFFIKNLCFIMTNDDSLACSFNSLKWEDCKAVLHMCKESQSLKEYICGFHANRLYLEMRNSLIILVYNFIKELRKREHSTYSMESYLKGMMIDIISSIPMIKNTDIAFRIKGVLWDVINYSFRSRSKQ